MWADTAEGPTTQAALGERTASFYLSNCSSNLFNCYGLNCHTRLQFCYLCSLFSQSLGDWIIKLPVLPHLSLAWWSMIISDSTSHTQHIQLIRLNSNLCRVLPPPMRRQLSPKTCTCPTGSPSPATFIVGHWNTTCCSCDYCKQPPK